MAADERDGAEAWIIKLDETVRVRGGRGGVY